MKLVLIIAPLLVGLIAAVAFIVIAGSIMARHHKSAASIRLSKAPSEVWALITDFEHAPSWRPGVVRCERLADVNGHPVWKEIGKGMNADGIPLEVETFESPNLLVTRIVDDKLPFGGTWTFKVSPDGAGSRLSITEDGFIKSASFRYIGTIIGLDATIKKYLTCVAAKFGDNVVIEG